MNQNVVRWRPWILLAGTVAGCPGPSSPAPHEDQGDHKADNAAEHGNDHDGDHQGDNAASDPAHKSEVSADPHKAEGEHEKASQAEGSPAEKADGDTQGAEGEEVPNDTDATPEDTPESDTGEPSDEHETDASAKPDESSEADKTPSEDPKADAAEADAPEDNVKAILKEIKDRRTSDERARQALAEAESAGAKPSTLAQAAFERGKALHAEPARAAAFYEWAAKKDKQYPDPVFELAKQAVVEGEIGKTIELLKDTKARGGTKLLQQIEFDPTWEIVKDEAEVRSLL